MSKGLLIVTSGPSGVGKGTIVQEVRKQLPDLGYSISVTTRKPRAGEVDGVNYFFVDQPTFMEMIDQGELLEYAEVFGNFYGTPKKYVEQLLEQGKDVLLEIDVQGGLQVKKMLPKAILIFIAPPNMKILEERLRGRATEEPDVILRRLIDAAWELSQQNKYDYVLTNDELEACVKEYLDVVNKEKEQNNEHN